MNSSYLTKYIGLYIAYHWMTGLNVWPICYLISIFIKNNSCLVSNGENILCGKLNLFSHLFIIRESKNNVTHVGEYNQ